MSQETSLGNAIGLVVELLRHHLVEIFQLLMFEDLRVQSRNTVHGIACRDRQMGHLHLSVVNDRHLADLLLITRIFALDLDDESAVNLLHDLINTGQ